MAIRTQSITFAALTFEDLAADRPRRAAKRWLRPFRCNEIEIRLPEAFAAKEDSDDRRAVDDHTPPFPYPRIRSRSAFVTLRPSCFFGMLGQISFSMKSRTRANCGCPEGCRAILCLRSSNDRRTVVVLD